MALIPLHRFSNGTVDETAKAFASRFCIILNNCLLAFGHDKINSIHIFALPFVFIACPIGHFMSLHPVKTPKSIILYIKAVLTKMRKLHKKSCARLYIIAIEVVRKTMYNTDNASKSRLCGKILTSVWE